MKSTHAQYYDRQFIRLPTIQFHYETRILGATANHPLLLALAGEETSLRCTALGLTYIFG